MENDDGQRILIDAGHPDIARIIEDKPVGCICLTHFHVDHVQGLFPMRWSKQAVEIKTHCPEDDVGCADLFKYPGPFLFSPKAPFTHWKQPHTGFYITTVPLQHSKRTPGYVIEFNGVRVAWLCDTGGLLTKPLTT